MTGSGVVIALDLDGTLEDSREDMVASVGRVRAAFGLPARPGVEFREHVNRGMPHLYRVCFEELLVDSEAHARAQRAYVEDYTAHIADTTRLYDGMEAALEQLSALGSLAIVTNKPEGLSDRLLKALGVRERFAVVIGGDSCAEPKPSPVPLRSAAARIRGPGAAGGPLFMIGDSAGDVRCGLAAQATVIWCAWGYKDSPGELTPHATAGTPGELPGLVTDALARAGMA